MRQFRDIGSGELITIDQLEAELNDLIRNGNLEEMTIYQYVNECTGRNGTLEEII